MGPGDFETFVLTGSLIPCPVFREDRFMLRYLTAGESHGKALVAILDGMPAGLKIDLERINRELCRRQQGYGRSPRQKIEKDKADLLSGLKGDITLGSPIALLIRNRDFKIESLPGLTSPRPGHADLAGVMKYGFRDVRMVSERASARETAARVAVGALCKIFLEEFEIRISSHILEVGGAKTRASIERRIDLARDRKDTLGGIFDVVAKGLPPGLGSYVHYDRRLDGRIALSVMSIPGIKALEFGLGFGLGKKFGSQVHDRIRYAPAKGFLRSTNYAGGIEGGVTNGEPLLVRCCMKPIPTLAEPLKSVDIIAKKPIRAAVERADICAVEAAGVVAEAAVAFELARAFLEKFGQDCLKDIKKAYAVYLNRTR
jgi:chorismate synthase